MFLGQQTRILPKELSLEKPQCHGEHRTETQLDKAVHGKEMNDCLAAPWTSNENHQMAFILTFAKRRLALEQHSVQLTTQIRRSDRVLKEHTEL